MVLGLLGGAKGRRKNQRLPQAMNAEEIAKRDNLEQKKQLERKARRGSDEDTDSDDDNDKKDDSDDVFEQSEEEESEEEVEEKVQKAKGVTDLIDFEGVGNVNKTKVSNMKAKDLKLGAEGAPKPELSRREREELDKRAAKAAYDRKHAKGETDEAKADLARLAEVRKRRQVAAEAKKAEAEEAARAEAEEKKKGKGKKKEEEEEEEIVLELPPPGKGMKDALLKIKEIANDAFQKKYKLANAGGNKLAKMKYKDFQALFEDFSDTASKAEKAKYIE